ISQWIINQFKPFIFSKIELMIIHLNILFITILVLMMMIQLLALPPSNVYHVYMWDTTGFPMSSVIFATPSEPRPVGFNASGIIEENSTDAIYPAFNYSLMEFQMPENKDVTTNSSFLPVPDPVSESRAPSEEAASAQDASEMTQSAIDKIVNPSSLLSSAIDDIRESGIEAENSEEVQPVPSDKISFLDSEFSTIPLYGMRIPPKDYLIIFSDEDNTNEIAKVFATVRVPCNDRHETPLRIVLLDNWSSIAFPPPEMHLIDVSTEAQLCMFRLEYSENGVVDSYVTPPSLDTDLSSAKEASTAIALYNSGTSELKFPIASSITISRVGSL